MKKDYFDYPTPKLFELKEIYLVPYRFSDELQAQVNYLFLHPYNKHNKIYDKLHRRTDANDMLKSAYLNARYYMDNPQQFAHSIDNIAPQILVSMWRAFFSLNKHLRQNDYPIYYVTDMKLVDLVRGKFMDLLIDEIQNKKYMMKPKEAKKRTRNKATVEGSVYFEYLCSLE